MVVLFVDIINNPLKNLRSESIIETK